MKRYVGYGTFRKHFLEIFKVCLHVTFGAKTRLFFLKKKIKIEICQKRQNILILNTIASRTIYRNALTVLNSNTIKIWIRDENPNKKRKNVKMITSSHSNFFLHTKYISGIFFLFVLYYFFKFISTIFNLTKFKY